ncbi:MAG: PD-(D/E)XK nuclease family protein [Actinomycetota bacterium]|nr:PD-(D/E)XK nuclease family protein [Actinomycetota bacterium]
MEVRKPRQDEFRAQTLAENKPPEERSLSVTQIATWLSCRYRWRYAYVLGVTPKKRSVALERGTLVHNYLGQFFEFGEIRNFTDTEGFDDEAKAEDDLAVSLAYRAYKAFPKNLEVAVIDGVKAVEVAIEVPFEGFRCFKGYVDLVVRDKETGCYWLVDHKVRKSFASAESETVNLQMAAYQHILTRNGYPTVGSILYQIADSLPATPKMTQKGELSRQKIKTDQATYLAEIRRHGFDPEDYADLLFKLGDVKFHDLIKKHRSPEEIENTWNLVVVPAAQEIREYLQDQEAFYLRAWNKWECNRCAYLLPCTEEVAGRDSAWILETDYESREGRSKNP